jgi:glycerophosphoryl diester phosphodiesterase
MTHRPDWDTLPPIPSSLVSSRRPAITGHRGARGLAPENTLAAFQVAADLKIDGVEFDVQRTTDGHLIVFHDETVERITDGEGDVKTMTLAQIKALDAGIKFASSCRGERIPTLRETFDLLQKTDLLLFVELKDPFKFPGMEADVIALIREYGLSERCQIRSFYHPSLMVCFQLAPEIPISELWYERLPGDEETLFKTVDILHSLYTPEGLAHIHERGQQATAWTVNDLDVARRLTAMGIDGLTTDYPDQLLTLFEA